MGGLACAARLESQRGESAGNATGHGTHDCADWTARGAKASARQRACTNAQGFFGLCLGFCGASQLSFVLGGCLFGHDCSSGCDQIAPRRPF
jgi:hypothetical protein